MNNEITTTGRLSDEIITIALIIQNTVPSIYSLLQETPVLFSYEQPGVSLRDYRDYLHTLRAQLDSFSPPNCE